MSFPRLFLCHPREGGNLAFVLLDPRFHGDDRGTRGVTKGNTGGDKVKTIIPALSTLIPVPFYVIPAISTVIPAKAGI